MPDVVKYLQEYRQPFEGDLAELLRFKSVSADPACREQVHGAADWLVRRLQRIGLACERIETAGHPLVLAESPPVPGRPIALVYGHYDVQPPDPLEEWISPPFEPTVRDGNVYARGATDDKGQFLTHVFSVEAWLRTAGRLPIQVKFLIEGEEEIGSESLRTFLAGHPPKVACQCVVISDTCQLAPGRPAITYGLRGIAAYELRLSGPPHDLHSGMFGGAVVNPAVALASMLASLIDFNGRIQIPGFYDEVVSLSAEERRSVAALGLTDARLQEELKLDGLGGEREFTATERRWVRPSFDIHGLWGGYQGEGSKTVLPARAAAKFSFRLVPWQDPDKIHRSLEAYLQSQLPGGIRMELIHYHGSPAVVVPTDSPRVKAAARAIEHAFGTVPAFIREGGSIPLVADLQQELGAEILMLGWGQHDDNAHGPNEKFSLADFHRGIHASARLWEELAAC